MPYPRMFRVRQQFESPRLSDPKSAVRDALAHLPLQRRVRPGERVAITAGSRGIANIPTILAAVVQAMRDLGLEPFVVPAMGSHGGGTAEGQVKVLASLGITEASVGCPIQSSMETVLVGTTDDGIPIHLDRLAWEADHIVVVNRVKPHTSFCGKVESGLMKMLMIGLGKHTGAIVYHRAIVNFSFDRIVRTVGRHVLAQGKVLAGVAILENGYDETARIDAMLPEDLEAREIELFTLAKSWLPRLPMDAAELLIIDEMGKHISGLGMDTNVTGRKHNGNGGPHITRVFVRELAAQSHGNAHGIGGADFATTRLVRAIDLHVTHVNSLTAVHPEASHIPIHMERDRDVLEAALGTIGLIPPEQARIAWIRNTLKLEHLVVSEPCLAAVRDRPGITIGEPVPWTFDADGNLVSPLA